MATVSQLLYVCKHTGGTTIRKWVGCEVGVGMQCTLGICRDTVQFVVVCSRRYRKNCNELEWIMTLSTEFNLVC